MKVLKLGVPLNNIQLITYQSNAVPTFHLDSGEKCCERFGKGSGPVHMNFPQCNGSEYKLTDCYYKHNIHFNHNYDWNVVCDIGKIFIPLVNDMCMWLLNNDMLEIFYRPSY